MRRQLVAAVVFTLALPFAVSGFVPHANDRAAEILSRGRAAIGGEARLRAVTSLSVNASIRVTGPIREPGANTFATERKSRDYDVDLMILLPDKFVASSWLPGTMENHFGGIDGDRLVDYLTARGDRRPSGFVAFEEVPREIGRRQRELMRYLVTWLLLAPEQYEMRFSEATDADTPDSAADVLEVKGAHDFAARLFFSKSTGLLTMVTFREPPAVVPGTAPAQDTKVAGEAPLFKSIEAAPRSGAVAANPAATGRPSAQSPTYDGPIVVRLGEFRPQDGILFPHRLTIDGFTTQEWRISEIEVNPKINLRLFEVK